MEPRGKWIIFAIQLLVLIQQDRTRSMANSFSEGSVTLVVANLEAINTTTMLIEWNTEQKPSNITIYQFDIIVDQLNLNISIVHDSSVTYYSYNITRLRPGEYCNATLMVNYWLVTTEAPINTEVTVTTQGPVTTQAPDVQQDPIDLYSNTYPEAPSDVTLVSRDNQTLTFSWYQEGQADSCTIWTNSSDKHAGCSGAVTEDGNMTATVTNLQVAGMSYTVTIVAVRGSLDSEPAVTSERTLPPNPNSPICGQSTNTTLVFDVSVPGPTETYEIDGYDISVTSLIGIYPNYTGIFIPVTEPRGNVSGLVPGVTYNIEAISTIDGVKSASGSSSNCTTDLNVPFGTEVVNVTEESIFVSWQTPSGYLEGFELTCTSEITGKNVSVITIPQNVTVGACNDVSAGALYSARVTSILKSPPAISDPSEPDKCVTVPYAPKQIFQSKATDNSLELTIEYGYTAEESQCTHYNVSFENQINITSFISTVKMTYASLVADTEYSSNTFAISDYTNQAPGDPLFFQISRNATPVSAWTVAAPIVSVSQVDKDPWSLLIEFDPVPTNSNVWGYTINVKRDDGWTKTIRLNCTEATNKPVVWTLNCANSTSMENITCGSDKYCPVAEQLTTAPAADIVTTTSLTPVAVTDSVTKTSVARNIQSRDTKELSICHNITGLEPYINYTVSVQAVNPGGCSVEESSIYLRTSEWIPGCVNITSATANYDSVTLQWSLPDKPNGIIIGYIVFYNLTNDLNANVTTNGTTVVVKQLGAFETYSMTVVAETSVGRGEYINCPASTEIVETQIGPPFKPILTLSAINATAMNVSWVLTENKTTGPETFFNVTITDSANASFIDTTEYVPGFNSRSVVFGGLDEFWLYNVSIVAYTIAKNGTELATSGDIETKRTMESTPGPVQNVDANSRSTEHKCFEVEVTWSPPEERELNGIITKYTITWFKIDGSGIKSTTTNAEARSVILSVEPNGMAYDFTVQANTSVGSGPRENASVASTGFCRPDPVDETLMFISPDTATAPKDPYQSFLVLYDQFYFTDNLNGEVQASALLVAQDAESLNDVQAEYVDYSLYNDSSTWKDIKDMSPITEYRPTPDDWPSGSSVKNSRGKRQSSDSAQYVVGEEANCGNQGDVYCNGPLPSGKSFRVRGIICTQTDGPEACYKTKYFNFIYTTAQPSSSMAWIAGVIIPIVLIIILIIIFLYWRRRKNKDRLNQSTPSEGSRTDIPMQNPIIETTSPIQLYEFSSRVEDMHRNSDLDFNDEYQKIQDGSPKHPWRAAELADNRIKNRFVNILPFDHSRVRILAEDGFYEGKTDFINANYIPNRKNETEFVACQGPLPKTVDDFWQMVWEQHSLVIVMLTNLREKGRERCALYWPDEVNQSTKFWHVNVLLLKETVDTNFTIRKLLVTKGDEKREVIQYHYTTWPDFGVPDNHREVLNFVRQVRRQADNSNQHPVTVHCSAGVGRTGTFIALDQLLIEIAGADSIDIYGLVFHLRNYRCYMVQTEVQYVFIHDCMKIVINEMVNCVYENYNQGYDDSDDSFKEEPIYANQSEGYAHHDNVKVQMNGKNHHG